MHDADNLKKRIDKVRKSYAIAVKGQAFPSTPSHAINGTSPRVTVIEASSWAMANCFKIEKLARRWRKSWYIDERIAKKIQTNQVCQKHKVKMYPDGQQRSVHAYKNYLWSDDEV